MASPNDPRKAFDNLAAQYQSFRPDYPDASFAELRRTLNEALARGGFPLHPLLVDMGAGTGISTRQIAGRVGLPWRIVGIEPNADMRREAQRTPTLAHVSYQDGCAEAFPFADRSVSAVTAAQAAQWFQRPSFYAECMRVLHSGGVVSILQNNRDWSRAGMLDEYERFLEAESPGYTRHYRDIDFVHELSAAGFADARVCRVTWERPMGRDDFIGMALSSTKVQAVVRRLGEQDVRRRIGAIWRSWCDGEHLALPYLTEIFLCFRP